MTHTAKLLFRLAFIPHGKNLIEGAARRGLVSRGFTTSPRRCQKWARQVVQSVHGGRFDRFWRDTAAKTGRAFQGSEFDVTAQGAPKPGDLLYRLEGNGGAGHVGILIGRGFVAENSTAHGPVDFRGIRPLKQFGRFDVIVRLPDTKGGD